MAVIVEFLLRGATPEQLYEAESAASRRGEEKGAPPYDGCMFLAVTQADDGARVVSAWRTEGEFLRVLEAALAPDLALAGLEASDLSVSAAMSMAFPGAKAP